MVRNCCRFVAKQTVWFLFCFDSLLLIQPYRVVWFCRLETQSGRKRRQSNEENADGKLWRTRRAMYAVLYHYTKTRSLNRCWSGKARVALLMHHEQRMRRIVLLSVTCLSVCLHSIFPHYPKRHDFPIKLLNTKYVFDFLESLTEPFLTLRRIQRDMTINVQRSPYKKYPVFFSDVDETWIFPTSFRKILR